MNRTTQDLVERQIADHVATAIKLQTAISREDEARGCGGFLDMPARDVRQYSVLKAIRLKLDSIMRHAGGLAHATFSGLEAECHRELCARFGTPDHQGTILIPADYLCRDLTVASAGGGGYLVGTSNVSFIDALRNVSAAYRLGVQPMPGQRESITLPRQAGTSTLTWLPTESTQATESAATFEQIPGGPKTCSAYSEISRQLLLQSNPAAESVVMRGLAADVATGVDQAVFIGTGSNGQPQGVSGTSGIGSVAAGSLNYTACLEFQSDVADANAMLDPTSLGYVCPPLTAQQAKLRSRFSGTDSPLWAGPLHQGTIEGVTAIASKQMPANSMLFGYWSQAVVAEWGVLAVEVNPFANFQTAIVGVRAMYSIDVLVLHPKSFSLMVNIS